MKIEADLPFTFCKECKRRQIYYPPVLVGRGVIRIDTRCSRAEICKNAIALYQERMEDGRPIYADD